MAFRSIFHHMKSKHFYTLLFLEFFLLLILSVRFDREDIGPVKSIASGNKEGQVFNDSQSYVKYVEYFRGTATLHEVGVPFVYRPAVPWLASLLPFRPMTAINIVNTIALSGGLVLLFLFFLRRPFPFHFTIIGSLMYVVAFPTFYYGSVGFIDPVLIVLLILGMYCIFHTRWWSLPVLIFCGVFVKETAVMLIPVAITYAVVRNKSYRMKLAVMLLSFVIPYVFIKYIFSDVGSYAWIPSLDRVVSNTRPRALLSAVLTFGVPGFISLGYFRYRKQLLTLFGKEFLYPLMIGIMTSGALLCYSFMSAYTDGRFIWTAYPWMIPFALAVLLARKNSAQR